MLSDRRHTRLITEYGGLKGVMPRLVAAFLLITLASVALPGMNGFVGEFLILLGAFSGFFDHAPVYTAVAATGVILSAVYMLWMFQRVNYGLVTNPKNRGLRDLSVREWCVIAPVCAMAIFMGVVPGLFLKPMEPAVRKTIEHIRPQATAPINTQSGTDRFDRTNGSGPAAALGARPALNSGNGSGPAAALGARPALNSAATRGLRPASGARPALISAHPGAR
jgi:NADH-quinone oxidoreductase subunit M